MFINITIILHENHEHVPAVSTKYSHLAATPGAPYPPRLGLAYLGQYLGHILSKVYDCLLNHLFRCRSKRISKLRVTGLCAGNSPVTGEFPTQRASNGENDSIWWHHHDHDDSQFSVINFPHNCRQGAAWTTADFGPVGQQPSTSYGTSN